MANDLVLHPSTRDLIARLKDNAPHAFLLTSESGVGLKHIALAIAGQTAQVIDPDGETEVIRIEAIRGLYERTRGKSRTTQFFVIDNADTMTPSAQSAFLKLLEEPKSSTHFILTSHSPSTLLDTIRSRAPAYRIVPPESQAVADAIAAHVSDTTARQQLLFLADGSPSAAFRYIEQSDRFASDATVMADARDFLTVNSRYQRLMIAFRYAKQRAEALVFVDYLIRLLQFNLEKSEAPHQYARLTTTLSTRDALATNANIKLALTRLVVK